MEWNCFLFSKCNESGEHVASGRMFGSQFWSYSIICATQWGYDTRRIEMRNSSDYNEETWTAQINKLLTGLQGQLTVCLGGRIEINVR